MSEKLTYQIRIYLDDKAAAKARSNPSDLRLRPLMRIIRKHGAELKNQYDAFAGYVREAEKNGPGKYPLYQWTKQTIEDPAKKARYARVFTIYVDGRETYTKDKADALEAELKALVGAGLVTNMTKHDSDPRNNPQPPKNMRP